MEKPDTPQNPMDQKPKPRSYRYTGPIYPLPIFVTVAGPENPFLKESTETEGKVD